MRCTALLFRSKEVKKEKIEYLLHAIDFYSIKFKIRSVGDILAQSVVTKENKEEREKKLVEKEKGRKEGRKKGGRKERKKRAAEIS